MTKPSTAAERSAPSREGFPFRGGADPLGVLARPLGGLERILRALWRRLRRGEPLLTAADRSALLGHRGLASPLAGGSCSGRPVILLPAVPWGFRFQRPQQLALSLARLGCPVLYVDAFDRTLIQPRLRTAAAAPGVEVIHPRLPGRPDLYRQRLDARASDHLAATLAGGLLERPQAILAQLPGWSPAAVSLRKRLAVPLVYDLIDRHTAFPDVPDAMGELEEELARAANLVTATSQALACRWQQLRRVEWLPNAVAWERFELAPRPPRPPRGRWRVGFIGALNSRLDCESLIRTCRALPEVSFELAGRVEHPPVAQLAQLANVTLHGEIPYHRVPAMLATLHAGLLPFVDSPLTRAVDAVKLYEMLTVGLPVVARRLPGSAWLHPPLGFLYERPEQLPQVLMEALERDAEPLRRQRRERMRRETWDDRARALLDWLEDIADERAGAPDPS